MIEPIHDPADDPGQTGHSVERPRGTRWTALDLVVFGLFFGLTVIFLPVALLLIMRSFNPDVQVTDLTAVQQILFQGIMDVILVGFILMLVRLHGRSFAETIHWHRTHQYSVGFLVAMGATLAVTVLIVSSLFPPSEPPPIEKLISSTQSLYVFAIFGIGVAPLFEELIFRGFLFKILQDIGGHAVAVPATAGLFALLHVPQLWGSWAGITLIFAVGYVLALVRSRTNSLIPPVIIHTAYNGMLFALYAMSTLVQQGVPAN